MTALTGAAAGISPQAVFFPSTDGQTYVGTNFGRWARYNAGHIRFDSGLTLVFRGSRPDVRLEGSGETQSSIHLMFGASRVSRRGFSGLRYAGLYDGVDLQCRFSKEGWKSDFLLSAGTTPAAIRMEYQGIGQVSVGERGQLVILTASGEMEERIPAVYQTRASGETVPRFASYVVFADGTVGFSIDGLDPSLATVIDPDLLYSSYWGGNRNESITAVAMGTDDSMFIAGWTESANMTTANAYQLNQQGSTDGFVAKLSANGQSLIWATFIGGISADRINGMAVDVANRPVVVGSTASANFPVQGAIQGTYKGGTDGFVARLAASGAAFDFSTFFGGTGSDAVNGVAVDSYGIYIGGQTTSFDFPVANAAYSTPRGAQDGFAAKINTAGSAIVFSTYLGGASDDSVNAVAVYQQNLYVAGGTSSSNLPVVSGSGPRGGMDGFVMRLSQTGTSLAASTYWGGSCGSAAQPEMATSIAVTGSGEPVVGGFTCSSDFPVLNAAQSTFGRGGSDGFVTKFTPYLGSWSWSTYLGGSSYDAVYAVAVRSSGQVVAAGMTSSSNFPLSQPLQSGFGGYYDGFVSVFLSYGPLSYSTLWGGNGSDAILAVAAGVVNPNAVLAGGTTSSNNLTIAGSSYQSIADSASLNAFFAKFQFPGGRGRSWDKVGIFRQGGWALDKTGDNVWNAGDVAFSLGISTDIPIVGDWTGTGVYRVGVFRGGTWYVDINGDNQWTWGVDAYYYYGIPGDIPVVGDWNGDGRSKIGVYRNGVWFLDWDGNNAWTNNVDKIITWGASGDVPVVGDWTGSGTTKIGLYNNGIWRLDTNGDFIFTPGVDPQYTLGSAGDIPAPMWTTTVNTQPVVWRPSNGAWISLLGILAYFGYPGDVPIVGPW
jgi:hypothetical protein